MNIIIVLSILVASLQINPVTFFPFFSLFCKRYKEENHRLGVKPANHADLMCNVAKWLCDEL